MSDRPHFGAALGDWKRFTSIRQQCPGCSQAANRESHALCRLKTYERGVLVNCHRMSGGASLPNGWHDLGNTGGLGCRGFFIPESAAPETAKPRQALARTVGSTPRPPSLPLETIFAWCEHLHRSAASLHRSHSRAVASFYAGRGVPFDPHLYSVGPSRLEAKLLVQDGLLSFLRHHRLADFAGLPGVLRSKYGDGAFFPAAKHGEAWEWSFDVAGVRRGWSRRFLHPDGESKNGPKSKSPSGARHYLHYTPGWRERVQATGALLVTEGTRKANETQRRTGVASLGLPSVAISAGPRAELIEAIREARPAVLCLAPDFADLVDGAARHDPTRRQVLGWDWLVGLAEEQGTEVRALAWDADLGKGIDDVLASLRWEAEEGVS